MSVAQIETVNRVPCKTHANNRRTTRELDGKLWRSKLIEVRTVRIESRWIETQLLVMLTGLAPHHLLFSDFAHAHKLRVEVHHQIYIHYCAAYFAGKHRSSEVKSMVIASLRSMSAFETPILCICKPRSNIRYLILP